MAPSATTAISTRWNSTRLRIISTTRSPRPTPSADRPPATPRPARRTRLQVRVCWVRRPGRRRCPGSPRRQAGGARSAGIRREQCVGDRSSQNRTTDNPLVTSSWTARYPDLTGKAVVVSAESSSGESSVVSRWSAPWRRTARCSRSSPATGPVVDAAVRSLRHSRSPCSVMTADPASPTVWERVAPHIEQRLAPIDVAVAIGAVDTARRRPRGGAARHDRATSRGPDRGRHDRVPSGATAAASGIAPSRSARPSTQPTLRRRSCCARATLWRRRR